MVYKSLDCAGLPWSMLNLSISDEYPEATMEIVKLCGALIAFALAATGAALADPECHALSNYPQRAAQILNNYKAEVNEINLKVSPTEDSLEILTERKPRPAD
jgi:hypothetical protein